MIGLHPYTGRENAVPCQTIGCRRMTWRDDALCDPCARTVDRAPEAQVGGDAPPPSTRPRTVSTPSNGRNQ